MSMFSAFDVTASGLTAQRLRMDVISENVANANTTRTEDGTPYRRKIVTFQQKGQQQTFSQVLHNVSSSYTGSGVKVSQIFEDTTTEMNMVYDPSHPDADENGYVTVVSNICGQHGKSCFLIRLSEKKKPIRTGTACLDGLS